MTEQADRPFGVSSAVASLYRFVGCHELTKALEQFCNDLGIQDAPSVALMSQNRVLYTSLRAFWEHRDHFKPHALRDPLGHAAADFMAAETLTFLFGASSSVDRAPIDVPLVKAVMKRGAEGLFKVGEVQFDELAQVAVDLVDWLVRGKFKAIALIESPLGNSVPVAVIHALACRRGLNCTIVEWGCPRNDRALLGRTVEDSAKDLATEPQVRAADMVVFVDEAITGSRLVKMATALRRAVGAHRCASVGMRVRFNPGAQRKTGQLRSLNKVDGWAKALGLPHGELRFPDLPMFRLDAGPLALLETAAAWGDAAITAGKRKNNLLFYFLDRYEAIAKQLGDSGESPARDLLMQRLWTKDTSGLQVATLPSVALSTFTTTISALPEGFFDQIRSAAKVAFPSDFFGRKVAGAAEVRRRTEWLADCVLNEALKTLPQDRAHLLNNAIQTLSNAEFDAGVSRPPRDHDYGQGTFPVPPGEDALHLHLVDLIMARTVNKTPRQ